MFYRTANQRIFRLNLPQSGHSQTEEIGQRIREHIEVIGPLMFQETSYCGIQIQGIGF